MGPWAGAAWSRSTLWRSCLHKYIQTFQRTVYYTLWLHFFMGSRWPKLSFETSVPEPEPHGAAHSLPELPTQIFTHIPTDRLLLLHTLAAFFHGVQMTNCLLRPVCQSRSRMEPHTVRRSCLHKYLQIPGPSLTFSHSGCIFYPVLFKWSTSSIGHILPVCIILWVVWEVRMVLLSSSRGPNDPLLLEGEGEHSGLVGGGQVQLLLQQTRVSRNS
jgi:hypothetical protein